MEDKNKITNETEVKEEKAEVIENIADENEKFSYQYKVSPEETDFALTRYFKKYLNKRNYAYTAVFAFIIVLYGVELVRKPESIIFWILGGLCLALVVWLWLKPGSFKKKTIAAAELTKDDVYECKVYESYLTCKLIQMVESEDVGERVDEPQAKKIDFKADFVEVENYDECILLFINKEMTFIIPKGDMTDEIKKNFKTFFENNCGENYTSFPQTTSDIKD